MWAVAASGGVDSGLLKQRWHDEHHDMEDFKYALPYMYNGLVSMQQEGKTPTQQDAWNLLIDGETPQKLWTSHGVYETKTNRIYNTTGAYKHDEETGLSYLEGRDEDKPVHLYDEGIYNLTGGVPVNDEEDD